MARIRSLKRLLFRNERVELIRDIGPIPAGVYIYKGKGDGFLLFSLPGCADFGIEVSCREACRRVPREMSLQLTRPDEFLKSYYNNMERASCAPNPNSPYTFCMVHSEEGHQCEDSIH